MLVQCEFGTCKNMFERRTRKQRFCTDPLCVAERVRSYNVKNYQRIRDDRLKYQKDYNKKRREVEAAACAAKKKTKTIRKRCVRCGAKHENFFDLCNTCRSVIASSYDLSMASY